MLGKKPLYINDFEQLSPWQLTRPIPRRQVSKRGMGLATRD